MGKKKRTRAERAKATMAAWKSGRVKKSKPDIARLGKRKGRRKKPKPISKDGTTEAHVQARYKQEGYPPQWNIELRRSIRKRDGGQCVICAKTNLEERSDSGFAALPVHHIDKDKTNCDPCNLITMCSVCHDLQHWGHGKLTAVQLTGVAYVREERIYIYEPPHDM